MAYKDGVPIADCLMEAAAWGYTVKIACECGHTALYDPRALWWLYERKGWVSAFSDMRRRQFCSRCYMLSKRRVRPTISATDYQKATVDLPLPPDDEWKRAKNRFR